jgi:hypothetical protein
MDKEKEISRDYRLDAVLQDNNPLRLLFWKQYFCKHKEYDLFGELLEGSDVRRGGSGVCIKMASCRSCKKVFKKTWAIFT